jgi:vacuolar-type H+-ATPase subunit F/Vma7
MRSKMLVVTSPELAVGFRLAGVDVAEAATPQEAEAQVEKIILGSDIGIVAVSEDFHRHFSSHLNRLIRDSEVPLIIPFPGKDANVWKVEDRLDYVASLIRSAIGYHIKLTR